MFRLFKRPSPAASADTCYYVEGFVKCPYFHAASEVASRLESDSVDVHVRAFDDRTIWLRRLESLQQRVQGAKEHQTSPIVFKGCHEKEWQLIGGYRELAEYTCKQASPQ